ncbi:MAG: hypothetical protein EOO73_14320 [Myxococcales bacterium]|nr:MAG: hypothetical protein EOO73_14320 [Myxococcales bacterium]
MSNMRYWALGALASSLLTLGSCFAEPDPAVPIGRGGAAVAGGTSPASGASASGTSAGDASQGGAGVDGGGAGGAENVGPKTVLVVMEGLRPELVTPTLTPNLWRIAGKGVRFSQASSVLPSNRMAAAGSLATGLLPARHGVLGERMFFPGAVAQDSLGRVVDTSQPVSLGDRGTLESLQGSLEGGVLKARSLLEVAREAGFRTAVIGRSGPASLFDISRGGWVLDDSYVYPRAFARSLAELGLGVPSHAAALFPELVAPSAYRPADESTRYGDALAARVNDPYAFNPVPGSRNFLNPLLPSLHTFDDAAALEAAAAKQLLSSSDTDLLVLWMRAAGETALRTGPGSLAEVAQLEESLDRDLGALEAALPEGSNLVLVSDAGTSALAGDAALFPRWGLNPGARPLARWAAIDTSGGIPVDGAVRLVDLLGRAGFTAHDGQPCLSGHAYTTYKKLRNDGDWSYACRQSSNGGELTGPALVPPELDPNAVVVVSNGASELLYVPSHRVGTITKLVAFLQSRPEVGSVFVAPRYAKAALPGTLDLSLLGFADGTLLDVLVTYHWDDADVVGNAPLIQGGFPELPGLKEGCPNFKPCRPGLYCDALDPSPKCKFCPADQPVDAPSCNLAGTGEQLAAAFAQANAVSRYQAEGEACEDPSVCAAGLRCLYAVCRKPDSAPPLARIQPGSPLKGSSYGSMPGVLISKDAATTITNIVADYHGVRGGSSPADLGGILIMSGPAFKKGVVVEVPSGIVDIAPTLLHVLRPGLEDELGTIDGRLLVEALVDSSEDEAGVEALLETSSSVDGPFYSPTAPDSTAATLLTASGTYRSELKGFRVTRGDRTYRYITSVGATRSSLGCKSDSDCPAEVSCGPKGACLVTPSCGDGVKNGLENAVDCGAAAGCLPCAAGRPCSGVFKDCDLGWGCSPASADSAPRVCLPEVCVNGQKNSLETDVDCGLTSGCPLCGAGKACLTDDDCISGSCLSSVCQ